MTRREVLEHLVQVWGVQELRRLRQFAREYMAYQERKGYAHLARVR